MSRVKGGDSLLHGVEGQASSSRSSEPPVTGDMIEGSLANPRSMMPKPLVHDERGELHPERPSLGVPEDPFDKPS